MTQWFRMKNIQTSKIDKITNGDIREAHSIFAKELICMYNEINEFESVK